MAPYLIGRLSQECRKVLYSIKLIIRTDGGEEHLRT